MLTSQLQQERSSSHALRCEANAAELLREETHSLLATLQSHTRTADTRSAKDTATLQALRATVDELRQRLESKEQELARARAKSEDLARQLGLITSQFCHAQLALSEQSGGSGVGARPGRVVPRPGGVETQASLRAHAMADAPRSVSTGPSSHASSGSSCRGGPPPTSSHQHQHQPKVQSLSSARGAIPPDDPSRGAEGVPRGRHDSPTQSHPHGPGGDPGLQRLGRHPAGQLDSGHSPPTSSAPNVAVHRQDQCMQPVLHQNNECASQDLQPSSQQQEQRDQPVLSRARSSPASAASERTHTQAGVLRHALSAAEQQRDAAAVELAQARQAVASAEAAASASHGNAEAATASLHLRNRQLSGDDAALAAMDGDALRALEAQLSHAARCVREALVRRAVAEELMSCGLCMDANRAVAFGCGHQVCTACAAVVMEDCPFCRAPISVRIRLFDS